MDEREAHGWAKEHALAAPIPSPNVPPTDSHGWRREWYNYFIWLGQRTTTTAAPELPEYKLVGQLSVVVSGLLQNGLASLALKNDQLSPEPRACYGTDDDGAKGWHLIADALDVTADLTKDIDGTTNVVTFGLADLADSGVGASLVKITRDAKGRVEGTEAANLADLDDVAATAPSDGQVLTFDTTNGWQPETPASGSSAWTTVKKTADENRASTTVQADDSQLIVALAAGTYHVRARLIFETANGTMDLKCSPAFSGTASSILRRLVYAQSSGGTTSVVASTFGMLTPDFTAAGLGFAEYDIVFTASTPGNFSFQWAQNTSNASNLTLHRGSYLEYMAT